MNYATKTASKVETFSADKTKRGLISLWESGGAGTNTGRATIICKKDGSKPKAVYVRTGGQLACDDHALIPIHPGYYIIKVSRHHDDYTIKIYQIIELVDEEYPQVKAEEVNEFSRGEWDTTLPDYLEAAVNSAKEKSCCWHCRNPHYIQPREEK